VVTVTHASEELQSLSSGFETVLKVKTETVGSSETLVMDYLSTQRRLLEDSNVQTIITFIYGINILLFVVDMEKQSFL
jgi:hypothetical protein